MFSDRPDFNDKKNHKILRHGHLTFYLIKDRETKTSSLLIWIGKLRVFYSKAFILYGDLSFHSK